MKQIKIKSYGLLAALIMLTVSLTSCDEPDQYYSDNLLTYYGWELVAVNGVPVVELDVCEFQFYDFGNGTYGRYNERGEWYTVPITWEVVYSGGGAEYLYVYAQGAVQPWEYQMRLYSGRPAVLELDDLFTGDRLTFQAY